MVPGGVTYVAGLMSSANPAMSPVYGNWRIELGPMTENLELVRARIKQTLFNDLFQAASQFETRSNVTAYEWNMRKAESLVMLGPVVHRLNLELLARAVERTFGICARGGLLPPAPAEVQGQELSIQFISMLSIAQEAARTSGIQELFQIVAGLAPLDPASVDKIDIDYALERYNHLRGNDPRLIRDDKAVAGIRQARQQQQEQAQKQQMMTEAAPKLASAASDLSQTDPQGGALA
jgi:Bacteriophage head to tail connecting protein